MNRQGIPKGIRAQEEGVVDEDGAAHDGAADHRPHPWHRPCRIYVKLRVCNVRKTNKTNKEEEQEERSRRRGACLSWFLIQLLPLLASRQEVQEGAQQVQALPCHV